MQVEEKPQELKIPEPTPSPKTEHRPHAIEVADITVKDTIVRDETHFTPIEDISVPLVGDSSALTEEILEKLDCNLSNLESTFDKFVCKNRDFIQNLIESLNFEKQRQEDLKRNHCKIKQENDSLRSRNELLIRVNAQQTGVFKTELDRAIRENKAGFMKHVQHLEQVISCNKVSNNY